MWWRFLIDLLGLLSSSSRRRIRPGLFVLFPVNLSEWPLIAFFAVLGVSAFALYYNTESSQNTGQALVFLGCALVSVYLWRHFWRLYHYIADTPTSRIASASQGLVELHGIGDLLPGKSSQGIPMGPPCLWQAYTISEGDRVLETGQSEEPFQLQDHSGSCTVYPAGATVICSSSARPTQGSKRAAIKYLKPGAGIYVLGELRTVGGDSYNYHVQDESSEILRRWKADQRQLIAEYDTDGDGRIDTQEWQVARAKADQLAQKNIQQKRENAVTHEIRKPSNGLPLLISDKDPSYLQRRYYWLGIANLALAFACFVWGGVKLS